MIHEARDHCSTPTPPRSIGPVCRPGCPLPSPTPPGAGHWALKALVNKPIPCLSAPALATAPFLGKPVLTGPASTRGQLCSGCFQVTGRGWASPHRAGLHMSWVRARGCPGVGLSVHKCMKMALCSSILADTQLPPLVPGPVHWQSSSCHSMSHSGTPRAGLHCPHWTGNSWGRWPPSPAVESESLSVPSFISCVTLDR